MSHPIRSRAARRLALGAVASLALGTAACSSAASVDAITAPPPSLSTTPVERTSDGLQQRVVITPARPATGDTIGIRSVLVNRGTAPVRVEHVVCGLDYETGRDQLLANPFVHCAAYSITSTLAPGDSVVQHDRRVVAAPAGSYTIRVRHVVPPHDLYVDVPLTVQRR
ncbi:MAG: hypothetical protein ACXWZS_14885 [Gemmatirosa sp.]